LRKLEKNDSADLKKYLPDTGQTSDSKRLEAIKSDSKQLENNSKTTGKNGSY